MSNQFRRQQDVVNQERLATTAITVIGAGAVGSFVALALAKSGAERITVWDDDRVSEHNLPNQWYRPQDLGRKKVTALAEIVQEMAGVSIKAEPRKFVDDDVGDIVIFAVDSMDARIAIWRKMIAKPALLIDARMGAEVGVIYCVGAHAGWYADSLHPSAEAFRAPCTAKATMYCASGLAAFITAQVVQHVSARPVTPELAVDFRNGLVHQPNQSHHA